VESPPMAALVEHMLVASDNDYAEALARQVALARGVPATFENSAAAVRAVVAELGAPLDGVVTHDGSGLSRDNRIPPLMLGQLLAIAATGPDQRLRALVAGLAIAGVNGTLDYHYFEPRSVASAGLVRAKSGSLRGVTSLAGLVPAASGRLLTFAVEANEVRNAAGARLTIERITAALLACGCTDTP
jgi:serine-type D-Ala-D-Ala carboxypeptidase/endopeptidase (penicillin-binding protein 4)